MKRLAALMCMCGVAALAGCSGSSKPAASSDGMPDMQAIGKAMQAAATPGEMQKRLTDATGVWDGKCKFWMDPKSPPQESTCVSTVTSIMDGRFTRDEVHGTMVGMDGKTPMNFEGFGVFGYNNTTRQFEQTWCDNMGTMQMNFTGQVSADKKTIKWEAKFLCPIQHKMTWMREVETMTGPDTMTLEMWGPDMTTGKTFKSGEIQFTRRYGSH